MQQPTDVVVRPAIKHVPRSVVCDAHERIVRCGLGIVPVSSETEDKFEDAMEKTASSPLPEIARSRSRCQLPIPKGRAFLSGRGLPFSGRHFSKATREEARV